MSKRSSSPDSQTDWNRLRSLTDREIALTPEHPEAAERHIVRGIVRRGLRPMPVKTAISLRIDADILAWLKAQGRGYQTRINAILRAYRDEAAAQGGDRRAKRDDVARRGRKAL